MAKKNVFTKCTLILLRTYPINQVLGSFHNRKAKARSASGSGIQRCQVCLAVLPREKPMSLTIHQQLPSTRSITSPRKHSTNWSEVKRNRGVLAPQCNVLLEGVLQHMCKCVSVCMSTAKGPMTWKNGFEQSQKKTGNRGDKTNLTLGGQKKDGYSMSIISMHIVHTQHLTL